MTPEAILNKVCDSIDVLIEAGKPFDGLFPSLLDLETHRMLDGTASADSGAADG